MFLPLMQVNSLIYSLDFGCKIEYELQYVSNYLAINSCRFSEKLLATDVRTAES